MERTGPIRAAAIPGSAGQDRTGRTFYAWLASLIALLSACGGASIEGDRTAKAELLRNESDWHYMVRLDRELSRIDVTVCFAGDPPPALACGLDGCERALSEAENRTPGGEPADLEIRGTRILLGSIGAGDCIGYVVDVGNLLGAYWQSGLESGEGLLLNAAGWLLAPERAPDTASGTLRFELPDGFDAAVSWPREGDGYRITPRTMRFLSHTAFGRFERTSLDAAGASLDIVRLPGELALSEPDLRAWIAEAAGGVSTITDGFPASHALVTIVPAGSGGSGVLFGNVGRGGGSSLMLIVASSATLEEVRRDWVAVHELSHLTVPFVRRDDMWISEGLATYYQEVLRARIGVHTPEQAWAAIAAGCTNGAREGSGRTLQRESSDIDRTREYRRVYWAGAAIALQADVLLRREGSSLDEAVRAVHREHPAPPRAWSAAQLIDALDRASGTDVFARLAATYLPSAEFPDLAETYAYLGVVHGEQGVELRDAPGAAIRDAIMRR
jgi:hypothetical protein